MTASPFERFGLPLRPLMLAPLAAVSDYPFRIVCQSQGADLTYVEMISAVALIYGSKRTLQILERHPAERKLGVQVTARNAEEMGQAVGILNEYPFDTIDINMGCPAKKVVKSGCGSAILKDPDRVYATTLAACKATDKPVSVKIRIGWDQSSLNYLEVGSAAALAGASWLTVHGRARCDSYDVPVNLEAIAQLKKTLSIPVIGNGNLFSHWDLGTMQDVTAVDGFMISRGSFGNPWIFRDIKNGLSPVSLSEWFDLVSQHLTLQRQAYPDRENQASICMRKHILWYVSGWPHARKLRAQIGQLSSIDQIIDLLKSYCIELQLQGVGFRSRYETLQDSRAHERFSYDPKYDMDRGLERGVGDDMLD